MTYRKAISSLGAPEATLDDFIALAQAHGVTGLELRSLAGSLDLPAVLAASDVGAIARAGCDVVMFGTSLRLDRAGPEERAAFLQFVPWAERLGVRWLRAFDGGETAGPDELARAAETVAWWRAERAARGLRVDLCVETHDSLFTAAAIGRFQAAAPGTAILWDSHHTWRRGGEDPAETWRAIGRHVVHVHVKDSVSEPAGRHPFRYVLPGQGEFPMARLRAALAGAYSGAVALEWERRWHPYLEPLDAALAAADRGWW